MNEEEVTRSGLIPERDKASLLSDLKDRSDYQWMLMRPHPTEDRLQGDIFSDFPVTFIDHEGYSISARETVMLINNTCDLQPDRRGFVSVAVVRSLDDYVANLAETGEIDETNEDNKVRSIRQNQKGPIMYVPKLSGFGGGAVVFFNYACSVAVEVLEQAIAAKKRVASFSQNGFYMLLMKLNFYLVRPETDEVSRELG